MIRLGSDDYVGRVVATEAMPAGPHQFYFWTAVDATLGIGAIVRVDGDDDRIVFAVVVDGRAYTDLATALHDVLATDGDPSGTRPPTKRVEVRLWTAAVLRQEPEEPVQPVPLAGVRLATRDDVAAALRMDLYVGTDRSTGLPIGLYTAGGTSAPIHLDAEFLLGPESAHLNLSGVSGLATKTSAVQFFLSSIFQTFPAHKGSIAAVCINVKGPDLCFLDQPGELTDGDRAMYAELKLEPRPFDRVRYYAPFKGDGVNLNTLRSHPDLVGSVQPLVWGLREVLDYHEVLMSRDDIDAKSDGLIDFLAERVVEKQFDDEWGNSHRVRTFADLERLFRAIFDGLESQGRGDMWRTHHIATIRKVRNRLLNISTRCKGLVTDDGTVSDLPFGEFEDRSVHVVDVAGMDQLAQDLAFTRVVSELRDRLERRDLGVDHVIVFVDELNKYAPGDGPETYVRKMLLDISERGRYLGLVLFSAQQFRSQVHRRVVGNAGTTIYGRMDMDELATPGYQVLSPATKIKLATLPKGQLMIRHPHFTQPVFVRFPRPPVLPGPVGIQRYPPAKDMEFEDAVVLQLVGLDRQLEPGKVKAVIAGRREVDVRRALLATRRARPDDVLAFFRAALGPAVERENVGVSRVRAAPLRSVEDPYVS
ncbi:MAG: ATP-binding protein [Gemmatimonadales bacterium]